MISVRHVLAMAVLATAGCLAPADPGSADIAAVHATIGDAGFAADTIQLRATTRVHATAIAAAGYDLGVTGFTYASSDPAVALVESDGTVRGVGIGSATITATAPKGGRKATVTVLVVPSTIAYHIAVGGAPGAIAFSTDYTRAYVAVGADSVAIVDALGFFRTGSASIGYPAAGIAATASEIYLTHPALDSVSRVATGSSQLLPRTFVGAGPTGIVSTPSVVMIAARYDRRIAIVDGGDVTGTIALAGEPVALARTADASLLFATVDAGADGWRVAIVRPASRDTVSSFAIPAAPAALAVSATGDRVYLLYPSEQLVRVYLRASNGGYSLQGTVATGTSPGGIGACHAGRWACVVVSGEPALVLDGTTLQVTDRIAGTGTGAVAVRPDGLFAFVSSPSTNTVNVLGL